MGGGGDLLWDAGVRYDVFQGRATIMCGGDLRWEAGGEMQGGPDGQTYAFVRTYVRRVWGDRPVGPDGVLTHSLNRLPASRDEVAVWRCVHDKIDYRGSMIVAGGVTRVTRDPVTA